MKQRIKSIKEAFSYTTAVQGKTWSPSNPTPPFKVQQGPTYFDGILNSLQKQEELNQRAPNILPFPLDRIVDQLATDFIELEKTRGILLSSYRTALLSNDERMLLKKQIQKIKDCMKVIKKMSYDVEKLKIGFGT